MTMLTAITNFMSVWDNFVNPELAQDARNAALAKAIQNNSFSPDQSDQLEDILSSPEKSEQFFNDPMVQEHLVKGLIADTHIDEKVLEALKTCTPSLSTSQQQDLFDNQFSWLSQHSSTSKATVALRFFADVPDAKEIKPLSAQTILTNTTSTLVDSQELIPSIASDNSSAEVLIASENQEIPLLNIALQQENSTAIPNLAISLQNGNTEEIKAYGELLKSFEISRSDLLELLSAKNGLGAPGILLALKEGHTEAIKAYGELLKAFEISGQDLLELLSAKSIRETPALYFAMAKNKANAITAYGELLKAFAISGQDLLELLSAKNATGTPCLAIALEYGCTDAIAAYGELLKAFEISGQDLLELLSAKSIRETPALYFAMAKNKANAITAYGELLKAFAISGQDLLELLSAKNATGTPCLAIALEYGCADAIAAYGELLKLSGILNSGLLKLLNAETSLGILGLRAAFLKDHTIPTVKAYFELCANFATPIDIRNILQGGNTAQKDFTTYCRIIESSVSFLGKLLNTEEKNELSKQKTKLLNIFRESHRKPFWGGYINYSFYNTLKIENPKCYQQFKKTKEALKNHPNQEQTT